MKVFSFYMYIYVYVYMYIYVCVYMYIYVLLLLSRFSRVWLCATPETEPTRLPRPWDSPGKNTGVGCHFLLQCMKVKSEKEVAPSCPTLSDPMDYSLPGSSVHGIFQARGLEWGAIAFSNIYVYIIYVSVQFSSVQSLSRVRLFATPWITARQVSLSITNSWS